MNCSIKHVYCYIHCSMFHDTWIVPYSTLTQDKAWKVTLTQDKAWKVTLTQDKAWKATLTQDKAWKATLTQDKAWKATLTQDKAWKVTLTQDKAWKATLTQDKTWKATLTQDKAWKVTLTQDKAWKVTLTQDKAWKATLTQDKTWKATLTQDKAWKATLTQDKAWKATLTQDKAWKATLTQDKAWKVTLTQDKAWKATLTQDKDQHVSSSSSVALRHLHALQADPASQLEWWISQSLWHWEVHQYWRPAEGLPGMLTLEVTHAAPSPMVTWQHDLQTDPTWHNRCTVMHSQCTLPDSSMFCITICPFRVGDGLCSPMVCPFHVTTGQITWWNTISDSDVTVTKRPPIATTSVWKSSQNSVSNLSLWPPRLSCPSTWPSRLPENMTF